MLETALAVQSDRRSTEDDLSDDFNATFLQLCGPLVEIRQDSVVRFIHSSVGEFLSAPPRRTSERSPLSVNINNSHCSTAMMCLLYLWNEIPRAPLSGDAQMPLDPSSAALAYPFLSYAAEFWSTHACNPHDSRQVASGPQDSRQDFHRPQALRIGHSRALRFTAGHFTDLKLHE